MSLFLRSALEKGGFGNSEFYVPNPYFCVCLHNKVKHGPFVQILINNSCDTHLFNYM